MSPTKKKTKSKKEAGARRFELEIAALIEAGGYTAEQRVKACQECIDLSIARSLEAARSGNTTGSGAFSDLALRMQTILNNVEARSERLGENSKTDNKRLVGWADLVKSDG